MSGLRPSSLILSLALFLGCTGDVSGSTDPGDPGSPTDPGGPSVPTTPASDPAMAEILSLHNAARAAASPAPSPALSPLSWSDAAATAAQTWANGCNWNHDPKLGTLKMGQNIFAVGSAAASVAAKPADVMGSWVGEAKNYHYESNGCDAGAVCGHYTAVVWRSTTSVGCAHRACSTGSPFGAKFPYWDFWVCNYVPPGNWVGEKPY